MDKKDRNEYFRIYRNVNRKKLREYNRKYNSKWRKKNGYHNEKESALRYPEKERARRILRKAVSLGKVKKLSCKKCNFSKTEAHHPDYARPLKVIWLCRQCHSKLHLKNKKYIKYSPKQIERFKTLYLKRKLDFKKKEQERKYRNLSVLKMRAEGKTLQSVGHKFGITRERVRQICEELSK